MSSVSPPNHAFLPCSVVVHPWIPNCNLMALDLFRHSVKGGLKLYAPLFIIPAIIRRRKQQTSREETTYTNAKTWLTLIVRTCFEILRSSVFLGTYSSLFGRFFCLQRQIVRDDRRWMPWTSGFFAGLIAISVERSNRRLELALYCLNQSLEVVWRMVRRRGWVQPINNGEVFVFSLASAILMYFYQHDSSSLRGNVRALFTFLLGNN